MTGGAGRNISWTSFDMPRTLSRWNAADGFVYGPEHQRTRQCKTESVSCSASDNSLIYAGAQEVDIKNGQASVKTYWPAGLGVEIDKPGSSTSELNWTHLDRLGSIVGITDANGNLKEKLAYDAWGKRRTFDNSLFNGTVTPDSLVGLTDNKGYTGHEMLDDLALVHMNGRVYEPLLGKFLSGDPLVQDPVNGQNYNRYSYVLNNPTNLTDPTGFAAGDAENRQAQMKKGEGWETPYQAPGTGGNADSGQGNGGTGQQQNPNGTANVNAKNAANTGNTLTPGQRDFLESSFAGPGAANSSAVSNRDAEIQAAMLDSPNRYVAQAAPCVGHEGACAAASIAPLAGGWLAGSALGRFMLAAYEWASAPFSDYPGAVPSGFRTAKEFSAFGSEMRLGLSKAGYADVEPILQGSAVTGRSFKSGAAFDAGRVSDFDIALASKPLLQAAQEAGIGLRSAGTRTGPLSTRDLSALGLRDLANQMNSQAGRPVNFMIYDSTATAMERAPSVVLPR